MARAEAAVAQTHALEVEAITSERARLARDLHDVVAHHVSLVAVRAESAPYQHPEMDEEARAVLAAVAEDARAAMGELRQVLTVLQRSESEPVERRPQPGADDVGSLVADAVAAGQRVAEVGDWGEVPAAAGYVLYRAVQEGLTNARRHTPEAAVRLERRSDGRRVGFTMRNPATATAGGTGRGLHGMRERVESLGGTMSAARSEGDFVLDVTLPAAAPEATA